mmetsp:Transcript_78537/g.243621  ORF Transcript_78537/g.243621 Transcript_78537/m.243621 type:complete len:433 (+) Transcript_78537:628-1926(+)
MAEPCISMEERRPCSCSSRPWAEASSCACLSTDSPIWRSTKLRRSAIVWWPPNILLWLPFRVSNSLLCLSADSPTEPSRAVSRACMEAWCCSLYSLSCCRAACREEWVDFESATCLECRLLRLSSSLPCLSAESPTTCSRNRTRSLMVVCLESISARSPASSECALFSSPWLDSNADIRPWSCSSFICASRSACECLSAESSTAFSMHARRSATACCENMELRSATVLLTCSSRLRAISSSCTTLSMFCLSAALLRSASWWSWECLLRPSAISVHRRSRRPCAAVRSSSWAFRSSISCLSARRSPLKVAVCSRISLSWVWWISISFWSRDSICRSHSAARRATSGPSCTRPDCVLGDRDRMDAPTQSPRSSLRVGTSREGLASAEPPKTWSLKLSPPREELPPTEGALAWSVSEEPKPLSRALSMDRLPPKP